MPCRSVVKSVLCPGPTLPKGVNADTSEDFRCRGCRLSAGAREPRVTTESIQRAHGRNQATIAITRQFPPKGSRLVAKQWADFVDTTLVEIFEEACATQRPPVRLAAGEFSLVVTGSLSRRQATPYSDLEFFMVVDDDEKVKPCARMVQVMWQNIREMTEQTKVLTPDSFFNEASRCNVVTPSMRGLASAQSSIWPDFEADLVQLEALYDLMSTNMYMGGRLIAGDEGLLEQLKGFLRTSKSKELIVKDIDEMVDDYGGQIAQLFGTKLASPRPIAPPEGVVFDLKQLVLRPYTLCTLYLGRLYGVDGTGDKAQMKALYKEGYVSKEVYELMKHTLDAAQKLRQGLHAWYKKEKDMVGFGGPLCNLCLRNTSAFLGMCRLFCKQRIGDPSEQDLRRQTFCTKTPSHYDLLKIAELCK